MDEQTRQPRVYIVNKSAHDFSPAKDFGELVFVTKGRQYFFSTNNHYRAWEEALADSQPTDYIILTSLSILCSIGVAMFVHMHGRVNFLMFRTNKITGEGRYVPRTLVFDEQEEEG